VTSSASDVLRQGSAILRPTLSAHGFTMIDPTVGVGSGGPFTVGIWQRSDGFRFETHMRWALGIVRYDWNRASFTHQEYMRWIGMRGAYPGFSEDPLDGFRHLATDLAGPTAPLLDASSADFMAAVTGIGQLPRRYLP
jgi:hypothetical protein